MAAIVSAAAAIPSITRETPPTSAALRRSASAFNPDVALLPIGAYLPDNFRDVHASPEDALRGFLDLGARYMIPMHFGTFKLSQEPVDEPVKRLVSGARRLGIADRVHVLEEGVAEFF